jgi:hypothetical protein
MVHEFYWRSIIAIIDCISYNDIIIGNYDIIVADSNLIFIMCMQ